MVARILKNKVIIDNVKEASRIYNKFYGKMNEKLELSLVEACYLLEKNRIEIEKEGKKIELKEFIENSLSTYKDFEIKYLVYRDLRERGYILSISNDFLLYERGKKPPADPSFIVKALSERAKFKIREIMKWIEEAGDKRLLIGIVDEEGDLTYYLTKFFMLKGNVKEKEYEGSIISLDDRCIVWEKKLAEKLKKNFIGRDFGKYVQLSLMEAAYLSKRGAKIFRNGKAMTTNEFMKYTKKIQPDIEERLKVYEDLRKKNLLPKTGFKFGSHFRVYDNEAKETHAPYLVHVIKESYETTWTEISRAIRLAHSVKKEMIFAVTKNEEIKYVRIKRLTP